MNSRKITKLISDLRDHCRELLDMEIGSKLYIADKITYDLMSLMGMGIKVFTLKNKQYATYDREIAFNRWNKRIIYIKNYLIWVDGFQLNMSTYKKRSFQVNKSERMMGMLGLDEEYFVPPVEMLFWGDINPFEVSIRVLCS